MRTLFLVLMLSGSLIAQSAGSPKAESTSPTAATVYSALAGQWVGVLEYRDYSEPATSTKRVQLPTWMTLRVAPEGMYLDRVYDDGPNKTVKEHATLVIDTAAKAYKILHTDVVAENYQIAGLDQLKDGHGTLILTGMGTDSNRPAEIRETLVTERNLLSWLEEVRPANSTEPFQFRHKYTFVRAGAPSVTASAGK